MTSTTRFLFDQDFRAPRRSEGVSPAALNAAEERGRAAGLAEGRRQAREEAQARLAAAAQRLAEDAARLLAEADAARAAIEEDAVAFAVALGRRLAGDALRADPLGPLGEAAREAFQHLRGVPHLVVRVNETLVEEVDALVGRIARERGYEGRLVVLGEPDIAPGDGRLEWADGGVVRDRAAVEAAVAQTLAALALEPA
ncbi:MAG TPA: flagellar assembly protein FliH [Beijerinckiaceae bacterium]|nr:flagellar assembly protein FliH [Beijerinckiaceae bacterium]